VDWFVGCARPSSDRAILSPMTAVGMLVLPDVTAGISDAPATYTPSIPCTLWGPITRVPLQNSPHGL